MKHNILSIRLGADGLSFWKGDLLEGNAIVCDEPGIMPLMGRNENFIAADSGWNPSIAVISNADGCASGTHDGPKIVYRDTVRCVLVPGESYQAGMEASLMRLHGLSPRAGEQADVSKVICGTVAVMVNDSHTMDQLGKGLGEFAVASPLQYLLLLMRRIASDKKVCTGMTALAWLTGSSLYVTLFEVTPAGPKLVHYDIVPSASDADAVFALRWLSHKYSLHKETLILTGRQHVEKYMKGVFRKVTVI